MNQQKTLHRCRAGVITVVVLAVLLSLLPMAALAADDFTVSTVYTGLSVKAGTTMNYPLEFKNNVEGSEVELSVVEMPEGWKAFFFGNNTEVSHIYVGNGTLSGAVALNVQIPWSEKTGTYEVVVRAQGDKISDDLTLVLHVTEEELGNSSLDIALKEQTGDTKSSFSFTSSLSNNTPNDQSYALSAQLPEGWSVSFKNNGTRIASLSMKPRSSDTVTIEVTPASSAPAGTYKIPVMATSATEKLESEVTVIISGNYEIEVSTPSGLLSFDATANKETSFALSVTNTGNDKLLNVNVYVSVPKGWNVALSQSIIDVLEPGASATVTMTVTPGDDALTGDYSVKVEARNGQAKTTTDFRVTVKTETTWGLVGIGIIGLALIGLWMVFDKFGRR